MPSVLEPQPSFPTPVQPPPPPPPPPTQPSYITDPNSLRNQVRNGLIAEENAKRAQQGRPPMSAAEAEQYLADFAKHDTSIPDDGSWWEQAANKAWSLTPLGMAAKAAGINSGADLANFLGVGKTDTTALNTDIADTRRMSTDLRGQFENYTGRSAPGVYAPGTGDTHQAGTGLVGTAPTVGATAVGQGRDALASRVGATPAPGSAHVGAVPLATAGRAAAADPVAAARLGTNPAATAVGAQAATFDTADQAATRTGQQQLTHELQETAAGRGGPSAAELMLKKNAEEGAARQFGLATARAHGGNVGLSLRDAANNSANLQAKAGQDAGILRAQEIERARAQLGQQLGQTREQDIGVAGQKAGLVQQANLTNAQLGTQTTLANLGERGTNIRTQAQLEQEAQQKAAEREQAANLLNAQMGTQVGIANMGEQGENARTQAQLTQDAQQKAAERDLAARTTNATLGTQVSVQNAQQDLQRLLEQARLDQQRGITNATLQEQIAIKQAELDQATAQFNAGEQNKTDQFNAQQQLQAQIQTVDAELRSRGLDDAQRKAYLDAWLQAQGLVIQGDTGIMGVQQQDASNRRQLVGGILQQGGALAAGA